MNIYLIALIIFVVITIVFLLKPKSSQSSSGKSSSSSSSSSSGPPPPTGDYYYMYTLNSDDTISKFDTDGNLIRTFDTDKGLYAFCITKDDNIYVATVTGVQVYDKKGTAGSKYDVAPVLLLYNDPDPDQGETVWILSKQSNVLKKIYNGSLVDSSIKLDIQIQSFVIDTNYIWLLSYDSTIYKFDKTGKQLYKNESSNNTQRSFLTIAPDSSLYYFEVDKIDYFLYKIIDDQPPVKVSTTNCKFDPANTLIPFLIDDNNNIFINSFYQITHIDTTGNCNTISFDYIINDITFDYNGKIWATHSNGITIIDNDNISKEIQLMPLIRSCYRILLHNESEEDKQDESVDLSLVYNANPPPGHTISTTNFTVGTFTIDPGTGYIDINPGAKTYNPGDTIDPIKDIGKEKYLFILSSITGKSTTDQGTYVFKYGSDLQIYNFDTLLLIYPKTNICLINNSNYPDYIDNFTSNIVGYNSKDSLKQGSNGPFQNVYDKVLGINSIYGILQYKNNYIQDNNSDIQVTLNFTDSPIDRLTHPYIFIKVLESIDNQIQGYLNLDVDIKFDDTNDISDVLANGFPGQTQYFCNKYYQDSSGNYNFLLDSVNLKVPSTGGILIYYSDTPIFNYFPYTFLTKYTNPITLLLINDGISIKK